MTTTQRAAIENHGRKLLAIFPNAKERDPIALCRKLRVLEGRAAAVALRLCNGPEYAGGADAVEKLTDQILKQVNTLLGNVREYQPKTGAKCGCKRGVQRDNCPNCEGTGNVINFAAIRSAPPLVPVFINLDPRGYALKIQDSWMREQRNNSATAYKAALAQDWGGYGLIAPEIGKDGN